MAFTIEIIFNDASVNVLPIQPFYSPQDAYEWSTSTEPPTLIGHTETWNLTAGFFHDADTDTLLTAFNAFRDKLRDTTNPPRSAVFKKDGVAVHTLASPAYQGVRVEKFTPRGTGPAEWTTFVQYDLTVSARKPPPAAAVVAIDRSLRFDYDAAGLATRTLAGRVRTAPGAAQAAARLQGLGKPDATFGFVGAGPEGINVEVVDQDVDSEARFSEVVREHGEALPADVNEYSHVEETSADGSSTTTVVRVSAKGLGAPVAVRALAPAFATSTSVSDDFTTRESRATFTTKVSRTRADDKGQQAVTERTFSISGGGAPITFTMLTGGLRPVRHRGKIREVTVTESVSVRRSGITNLTQLKLPSPPVALAPFIDLSESSEDIPHVTTRGADRRSDVWVRSAQRIYKLVEPPTLNDFVDVANAGFGKLGPSTLDVNTFAPAVI